MLNFIFPGYLWLLWLIPAVWLFTVAVQPPARSSLRGRAFTWHTLGSLMLRTMSMAALVLALAGIQFIQPLDERQVVFLLDSSDSVALSQRARAEAYIQEALQALSPRDRAGIVVFGERALLERPPGNEQLLGQLTQQPPGTRTNIQDAVQLGLSLLPAESQRRLVLLSDGGENSGTARNAARLAAAQGVPIDVVPLNGVADGLDAQISSLELPTVAGEEQRLRLVVELDSRGPDMTLPATARLLVEQRASTAAPGESLVLVEQEVQLTGSPQRLTFVLPPPTEQFNRYVVQVQVAGDVRMENNVAEAFTLVQGRPRLLLVEGTPDAARQLSAALASADLDVDVVPPDQAPTSLSGLVVYDAMVLIDVPERALDERTIALLPEYVRDLGRGLAMIGGTRSFGAGGWRDTPVEPVLPVDMDLRPEVSQPPVSIVVVIDVSGSMSAVAEDGQLTKVELAAAGAAGIAARLRDTDEITVVAFDSEPQWIVGPLPGSQREEAIEQINRIGAGGGGINIYDALQRAADFVRKSRHPVRHVITITDGNDTVQQEGARDLVEQLRREGVTVSSIAVGSGKDVAFLEDVVQRGSGRFFLTRQAREIPDILANEAQSVLEPLVIEETFVPRRTVPHPILRDIATAPPLHGYVATTPKDSAQVLLASERNDPVLAIWQHGLGHSLAWTADMRGQWASDWVRWAEYQRVATRMIAWLLPEFDSGRLTLESRTVGGQLLLDAYAHNEDGSPATGLRVAGQMIAANGQSTEVVLREVLPGNYRLVVQDAAAGVYLLQLLASDAQGQPQAGITAGVAVPFSSEYHSQGDNPALLATLADMTGGRTNPPPAAVYDPTGQQSGRIHTASIPLVWLALLLLPFDVALRRLFRRVRPGLRAPQPAVPTPRPPAPVARAATADDAQPSALERMREAQERARKKARGEE